MKKILTPKQLLQIDVIKSMIDFFGGKFSSKIKTKNNLNKFFENVDEKIFFRGKNYYENDYVDYLKYYENENLWEAVVSGTEDYYVSIEFDDSEIKSWKCNCPYDGGPVCKHVIAVLFEIYFKLSEKNFSSSSNQSRKKQIEEIVERLSRKEWADFIEKNLSSESIDKLLDKYSILSGINSESKYYQIITKHLNNIINNSYLPEKECIEKEMRAINDLLLNGKNSRK